MAEWRSWLSGGLAGGSMAVVGHPFDTLKTRIQADKSRAFRSTFHCAAVTMRKEGLFALWRGIGPALLSTGLTSSIRFGVQAAANRWYYRYMGAGQFGELPLGQRVCMEAAGGFVAGLVLPIFFTPIELIKVRQQAWQGQRQQSAWHILRDIVQRDGVRGIYAGHSFTVWRSVIGNVFLFGPYELAKDLTGRIAGDDARAQGVARLVSGVLAGWTSWLSFFPLDVAKTRIQACTDPLVRPEGVLSALKTLAREGALYRGFSPILMRALPVHMAYLPVYDLVMSKLGRV